MAAEAKQCYKCGQLDTDKLIELYTYTICTTCKSGLGLFLDKTIQRHNTSYDIPGENNQQGHTYIEEIGRRLACLDTDYISKRIKLLHIQERLKDLN